MTETLVLAEEAWHAAGELPVPRACFGDEAVVLKDGRVLVVGGSDGRRTAVAGALLFDPATNEWTETGAPATARREHTTTVLPDGRVLIAGGETGPLVFPFNGLASAEIYDPSTETWTATAPLLEPRWGHTATLLPNGHVLVAGGACGRAAQSYRSHFSAELFDPVTEKWTPTGDLVDARLGHSAVVLETGQVLVVGGLLATDRGLGVSLAFCELYDVATGRWSPTGSLRTPRTSHTATAMQDGTVLVVGGWPSMIPVGWDLQAYSLWSTERYDPRTGAWSAEANLPSGRAIHRAALLGSGKLLVTGGTEASNPDVGFPSAVLFDPRLRTWTQVDSMSVGRFGLGLVPLADGRALAIGGIEAAAAASPEYGNDQLTATAEVFGQLIEPRPPTQEELDAWAREGEEWSRIAAEHHRLGRHQEAVTAERKAAALFLRLRRAKPAGFTWRWAHSAVFLGVYLSYTGQHDEAIACMTEAAEAYREIGNRDREAWAYGNLGTISHRAGRKTAAVQAQQQSRDIYKSLAAEDPAFRTSWAQASIFLGAYLSVAARHDEAIAVTTEAVGLYQAMDDQPYVAWAYTNLASRYVGADRYPDAVAAQTKARDLYRTFASADPAYRAVLAQTAVVLGGLMLHTSQYDGAVASVQEAVDLYRQVGDQGLLAWALGNLRAALQSAERLDEAVTAGQSSRDLYAELYAANPAYRALLADAALRLAQILTAARRRPEALTPAREAVALYEVLAAADPQYAHHLAISKQLLADLDSTG